MLVTPTPDLGKVLNAMREMKIEGDVNLATAVQIAQLALKHRQNKNQRQRIVIFIGSPIAEDTVRGAAGRRRCGAGGGCRWRVQVAGAGGGGCWWRWVLVAVGAGGCALRLQQPDPRG